MAVTSIAWAILVGIAVTVVSGHRAWTAHPSRPWTILVVLIGIAAALGIPVLASSLVGPPQVLVMGAGGGVLGGGLLALALRAPGPPEVEAAPIGPVLHRDPRRWRGQAIRVTVAGVSLAALLGASLSEPGSTADLRIASAAVNLEGRLPGGWERCCGGAAVFRGRALDQHICGSDDVALPAHTAAVARGYGKPILADDRFLNAYLEFTVLLARSPADAIAEFAAVDASEYLACTAARVETLAAERQSRVTARPTAIHVRRDDVEGVEGVIDTFQVKVPDGVVVDVVWMSFVRMRIGRAIVRMPVLQSSPEPMAPGELDAIVQAAIRQVDTALR